LLRELDIDGDGKVDVLFSEQDLQIEKWEQKENKKQKKDNT